MVRLLFRIEYVCVRLAIPLLLLLSLVNHFKHSLWECLSNILVEGSCILILRQDDLVEKQLFQNVILDGKLFKLEVEVAQRLALRDISARVIQLSKKRVLEYLSGGQSVFGVPCHQLLDEVDCKSGCLRN